MEMGLQSGLQVSPSLGSGLGGEGSQKRIIPTLGALSRKRFPHAIVGA